MGFGLTNAPATFRVLSPFLRVCVVVFLDDILIFGHSWSEHLVHLDQVLTTLAKEKLLCKLEKCEFGSALIQFLGHLLTGEEFQPDPEKLETARSWLCPKTVTDVRRFLLIIMFRKLFPTIHQGLLQDIKGIGGTNRTVLLLLFIYILKGLPDSSKLM